MFRNVCKYEAVLDNRNYQFFCENDSPIDHVREVLSHIGKFIDEIEERAKAQQEEQKPKEEEVVEDGQSAV